LNASYNQIIIMEHVSELKELRALVLNNNKIKKIEGVGGLAHLDTLVLSNNLLEEIEGIMNLTQLTKLSLSNNKIKTIPDLSNLHNLLEIKLNKNMIFKIPESLSLNTNLKIVDLGNNSIQHFKDIKSLTSLPFLKNLNLWGNLICEQEDYRQKVLQILPQVKVLDGIQVEKKKKPTTIVKTKRDSSTIKEELKVQEGKKIGLSNKRKSDDQQKSQKKMKKESTSKATK